MDVHHIGTFLGQPDPKGRPRPWIVGCRQERRRLLTVPDDAVVRHLVAADAMAAGYQHVVLPLDHLVLAASDLISVVDLGDTHFSGAFG